MQQTFIFPCLILFHKAEMNCKIDFVLIMVRQNIVGYPRKLVYEECSGSGTAYTA